MFDNRFLLIVLSLATMVSVATAEAISPPERSGVSAPEQGIRLHSANTARLCPSDKLPPIDSETTLQAVIDATFEGTYTGAACWLDAELLHRVSARQ